MTMTLASAAFGCSTRPTELGWDGLHRAARTYFPNGRGVSPTAKGELDTAFYVGLDLAQRAQAWTVADRRLHAAAFNALRRYIPPRISTPFDEHRRMVVAGCGDGRLARAYIWAAAQLGMDEFVFNDLHAFQVEATRHVVARLRLDRAPPRITFLAGDYANLAPDLPADLIVALFFVVPEITELSSAAALRRHRHRFFSAVANNLRPGGLFIEDTPEVNLPGFYADLRRRSRRVLVGHGVEPALAENLVLTCLPGMGLHQPCYVRCMPTAVLRHAEMMRAGFRLVASWNEAADDKPDHSQSAAARRLKRLNLWTASGRQKGRNP